MFHFHIVLTNPWKKDYDDGVFFNKTWEITTNKSFEVQINKFDPKILFEIELWHRDRNMDHRGLSFAIALIGFWAHFDFYDRRHAEDDDDDD